MVMYIPKEFCQKSRGKKVPLSTVMYIPTQTMAASYYLKIAVTQSNEIKIKRSNITLNNTVGPAE